MIGTIFCLLIIILSMIDSFEDLRVWQAAHRLTLEVYRFTVRLSDGERFGLISQLRRASVSVENNIAEGFGRRTTKDYIGFLYYAFGSLQELRCMFRICLDLGYINREQHSILAAMELDAIRMLNKLISSLKSFLSP
jgi:four helix bundle protein